MKNVIDLLKSRLAQIDGNIKNYEQTVKEWQASVKESKAAVKREIERRAEFVAAIEKLEA